MTTRDADLGSHALPHRRRLDHHHYDDVVRFFVGESAAQQKYDFIRPPFSRSAATAQAKT